MFSKIDVNGKNEDAFYTFLKSEKSNLLLKRIKWNFEKFLINKKGEVVARYASIKTPESLESIVQKLLAE
jgi:glutathione peroxidase